MTFSGTTRAPLESQHFYAVVIGGGIHGVAIARECARAGRRTLLVEQSDFASGTTSRSTRIVHGGLRYLQHGEIGLVRESLNERRRLVRQHPHLVQPTNFLLALDQNSPRSALAIRTALWLYKRMAGRATKDVRQEASRLERWLDRGRSWSIFGYEDAQCEFPERLVAEWLVEAVQAGAVARNHTQVLAVDICHGRSKGVLLRDRLSGKEECVQATWVINASGPWAERLCQRSRISLKNPMATGVRGSHIVLPRFAGVPDGVLYADGIDGRPIFVAPWNEQVLIGTTEVADTGNPDKVQPSKEEIEYLLRSVTYLFPKANFAVQDIRYAYAGIRSLPYAQDKPLDAVTRRHFLHDHTEDGAAQMISLVGGRLTTAAQTARECVAAIGIQPKPSDPVELAPEGNLQALLDHWILDIAEAGGVSESSARGIVEWHGKRSLAIAQMALSSAEMRAPLCPHTEHIVAEAVDALVNECAVTLSDVLLRRVPVAFSQCWSPACSREATGRIAAVVGWDHRQAAAELDTFENDREAFLCKPPKAEFVLQAVAD